MRFQRFWVIFAARNREFFRDRAGFGWNILFPFLLIAGFGIIFGVRGHTEYKVGVFPQQTQRPKPQELDLPAAFTHLRHVQFIGFASREEGLAKLARHKIDFLIQNGTTPHPYWVSDDSPKGYFIAKVFHASLTDPTVMHAKALRGEIEGQQIRHIDWLFPGIIGMNMMFSALWGVGYIVVRYRKTGVLKRLHATPLTAFEYLSAQMLSRVFVIVFSLIVVWVGCDLIFDFEMRGSYLNLLIVFIAGSLCLTSLGLLLASRGISEEFTTGALNFISWPMMFLSEVWFSIEGAPQWVQDAALALPLTHLLKGARKVMHDGANLAGIAVELSVLCAMGILFLTLGAALFSWNE